MFVKCDHPARVLTIFKELIQNQPTSILSLTSMLAACATLGTPAALVIGKSVHLLPSPNERDVKVESALILMYTKCGEPDRALREWDRVMDSGIIPGIIRFCVCIVSYYNL